MANETRNNARRILKNAGLTAAANDIEKHVKRGLGPVGAIEVLNKLGKFINKADA